jgi:hypothetical protein
MVLGTNSHPDLDARKIIYLGAGGDPWWDTKQLLD